MAYRYPNMQAADIRHVIFRVFIIGGGASGNHGCRGLAGKGRWLCVCYVTNFYAVMLLNATFVTATWEFCFLRMRPFIEGVVSAARQRCK